MENRNTILVVGQAKPSKEDAIYNLHGEFYISLIVRQETGKILELDCNTILDVTKRFVASMFVGKSLKTDIPAIEKEIRERYFALTRSLWSRVWRTCNRYLTAIGENCPQKKSWGDWKDAGMSDQTELNDRLKELNRAEMRTINIIVWIWKQKSINFNILKPELVSGCFSCFFPGWIDKGKNMIKLWMLFFKTPWKSGR